MEVIFQLIDVDYIQVDSKTIVRLFGNTEEGKTVCVFVEGYKPYFYILVSDGLEENAVEYVEKKFNPQIIGIEFVEKFLPFGFQKNKTKLMKIITKDPSQVPLIREDLLKQDFTKGVFEADILFKYRFMADKNLSGMKWYKAEGMSTNTNTVKTNIKLKASKIQSVDERNSKLKKISIDIEVSGKGGLPDPKEEPIAMISISFSPKFNNNDTLVLVSKPVPNKNSDVMGFPNEKQMLIKFSEIIDSYDPDVITGYNINNFDIPYILERFDQNKIKKIIGRCEQKPAISKKMGIDYRNSAIGRIFVDVYKLIKEMQVKTQLAEKGFPKLKRYGLDDVSKDILNEGKLDISHSEIPKMWNGNSEELKKLIDYARQDAVLAMKLLVTKSMLDKFIELSKVSGLLLQDVLDGGEANRVENMLLREFNKEDFVMPLKPSSEEIFRRMEERESNSFKGALVLEPTVGLHTTPTIYLDFKSMYPSIFIGYNICPSTIDIEKKEKDVIKVPTGSQFVSQKIRVGIMPRLLQFLINERDKIRSEAKKTADEDKKKVLESKQVALKYMSNAFFGYTGYNRARLYMLDIANAITGTGRSLIQQTKDLIELEGNLKVIYGDTDSIMVMVDCKSIEESFKLGESLEKKINENFKGIIQMKMESLFKTLLILTKKRYAGLNIEKDGDGYKEKIVMKGIETVRRDWCDLTSETLSNILQIVLKDQNPKKALIYMRDVIGKLERNEIPVEKLVVTKSISKSLKEYKGIQPHIELVKKMRKRDIATAPGTGDRVGYVIVQGLQLMSERAENPDYVKENKLKIDSKYYIESQILPPLERVFESIGISKNEIMGFGKQTMLSDMLRFGGTKKTESKVLDSAEGIICNKCSRTYRRPPLVGKCEECKGELSFYSGETKSEFVAQ